MHLLGYIAMLAADAGEQITEIQSISFDSDTTNLCGSGWVTEWSAVLSRSLQSGEELYWELADNAGGNNWAYYSRGTTLTKVITDLLVGSDDQGNGTGTRYVKLRCYVVPVGQGTGSAISGPVLSAQASETNYLCDE